MAGTLALLCCNNFFAEVKAALAAERQEGSVVVAPFNARCGIPPLDWRELRPLLPERCTEVVILGRSCVHQLGTPPAGWPPLRTFPLQECFDLVAGPTLIADAIAKGAYLVTPGWLADWRGHLQAMGFDETNASGFFQECTRELLFLDTGIDPLAEQACAEFSAALDIPMRRIAVGLDYTRLLLSRIVAEWRCAEEQREMAEHEKSRARERAGYLSAMDFVGRLAILADEEQSIAGIEEMYQMLFAPQQLHYIHFKEGRAQFDAAIPLELRRQVEALQSEWAWTESGTGFLLRIASGGETLGAIVADRFSFPEFRERYLTLALSVASVSGLAIQNARTYRRMKEAEEALRRSERSLTLAQGMAHLGHWEWAIGTEEFSWSEETYRIFGYSPHAVKPSLEAFFQVIYPEDRERVESEIRRVREGGRFDCEYRIILPKGGERVVRGVGEVVFRGNEQQPRIIGTIQALSPVEILGVIQDITDRKALEWRLEQEARTDPLTGCANRRHFMQQAALEFARVRRYGGVLTICMLDLDHFKAVNDRYGHNAGDATLQKLAQVCGETLRQEDLVGRLGGEEFAILLPQTDGKQAFDVAERLRQSVAAAEVVTESGTLHFTTSIGVATVAAEDATVEEVLGRADRALYEAKNSGRDKTIAAPCASA